MCVYVCTIKHLASSPFPSHTHTHTRSTTTTLFVWFANASAYRGEHGLRQGWRRWFDAGQGEACGSHCGWMRAWRCGARRGAAQQHTAVRHLAHAHNRHARAQASDKSDERACKQIETKAETQRSRDRGREEGQEGEENTCSHQPSTSKIKTMYKPRRPARTNGRMASSSSSSSLSLTLSLSLFLPSTSSATTNLWTADKSRPSLQKTAERRLGRKLTNRAAMHTQKCIVSKWCDAQLVSQWSLSQFGKRTLRE